MTKRKTEKAEDVKELTEKAEDVKELTEKAEESDTLESSGRQCERKFSETGEDSEVIDPVAFAVTLNAMHPQASYGRCGYRFNKEEAVEIPRTALTGEQIITLFDDPYLTVIPMTEA